MSEQKQKGKRRKKRGAQLTPTPIRYQCHDNQRLGSLTPQNSSGLLPGGSVSDTLLKTKNVYTVYSGKHAYVAKSNTGGRLSVSPNIPSLLSILCLPLQVETLKKITNEVKFHNFDFSLLMYQIKYLNNLSSFAVIHF